MSHQTPLKRLFKIESRTVQAQLKSDKIRLSD
jgi:hypothetical protein